MRFGEINNGRYVESEGWVKGKTVVKPAVFCRGELAHRLQSGVHTVSTVSTSLAVWCTHRYQKQNTLF